MLSFTKLIRPSPALSTAKLAPACLRNFASSAVAARVNTSTRTKENVHDLETFFKLIGRNTVEHIDTFDGELNKFLTASSKSMKAKGIDVATRRYMLRWQHKFVADLEPLREHKRGKKKNGGERKAKAVKAKKIALEVAEERERFIAEELEAERKGERQF